MEKKPNKLLGQTSPYLLQHLYNPVDWRPWSRAALDEARDQDLPIFLSIGYAACHWCHVMERESFEDEQVARFLNDHFISIKVDREERPDLDEIYMNAIQIMTHQGGWPLNMFLTPDQRPFFGGTYFPPSDAPGRPGFLNLLNRIHETWTGRRPQVEEAATGLTTQLRAIASGVQGGDEPSPSLERSAAAAVARMESRFDPEYGGFGHAPKFPPDQTLAFLLRNARRTGASSQLRIVHKTLDGMARGGIYDPIGGGFCRYSVDHQWLVPHFEKMLYSQALLVPVYAEAWKESRNTLYRRTACDTLDFVRRELTSPEGGAFSSLDADSEGVEGKYYVWTPAQIRSVLGREDAELFCRVYDIREPGNFEGGSIPNLLDHPPDPRDPLDHGLDDQLRPMRSRLLEERERRVRPGTDDKVLTSWNGLMITAYVAGYDAFGRKEDLEAAERCADFLLGRLVIDGRLFASWREGTAAHPGYLDDHAFLARGLLDLYEAGRNRRYLEEAVRLGDLLLARFEDKIRGGWYFIADDHEKLLVRNRSGLDGALPSGAGIATEALARIGALAGKEAFRTAATRAVESYRGELRRAPDGCTSLLVAMSSLETC